MEGRGGRKVAKNARYKAQGVERACKKSNKEPYLLSFLREEKERKENFIRFNNESVGESLEDERSSLPGGGENPDRERKEKKN